MEDADYSVPVRLVEQGIDWSGRVTAVASAVGLALLAATALFAYFALRDSRRTRHAQLIIELQGQWNSREVRESLRQYGIVREAGIVDLVTNLYGPNDHVPTEYELETYYALGTIGNLVETIGALASEGAIPEPVIYKLWGGVIIGSWQAWDTAAPLLREYEKEPDIYYHFQQIAEDMVEIRDRIGANQGDVAKEGATSIRRNLAGSTRNTLGTRYSGQVTE